MPPKGRRKPADSGAGAKSKEWGHPDGMDLSEIDLDAEYEGVVTNVGRFGVFVDFGAVKDGLLKVPNDIGRGFTRGMEVKSMVVESCDPDAGKVVLTVQDESLLPEPVARQRPSGGSGKGNKGGKGGGRGGGRAALKDGSPGGGGGGRPGGDVNLPSTSSGSRSRVAGLPPQLLARSERFACVSSALVVGVLSPGVVKTNSFEMLNKKSLMSHFIGSVSAKVSFFNSPVFASLLFLLWRLGRFSCS